MKPCESLPLPELLEGTLEGRELDEVLGHLESCVDCRERLQVMAALTALRNPSRRTFLFTGSRARYLSAAACLLVVLLVALFLRRDSESTPSPRESPVPAEAHPYFPLETRGGPAEHFDDARAEAFRHYSAGRYEEAEKAFSKLEPDADVFFHRGVTRFLLGLNRDAMEDLERAAGLDPARRRPVLWYRSQLHLRMGEPDRAVEKLRELARTEGEYREKAQSLLESLQRKQTKGQGAH